MEDRELIDRYRLGDRRAFESLLRRHETGLLRYMTRSTHDSSLAQDIVQETFLALIHECERGGLLTSPRAWLYQVARNRARDIRKKEARMRARHEAVSTPEATPADHGSLEHEEEACLLANQLERLPAEVVEVLSLKVLDGMSYREISTITGHSVGKVANLIHQGLSRLGRSLRGTHETAPYRRGEATA